MPHELEILSIILKAIQIAQGFHGHRNDPRALSENVKKSLEAVAPLYELLNEAKAIHDFLESISHDVQMIADDVPVRADKHPEQAARVTTQSKALCRRWKANPKSLALPKIQISNFDDINSADLNPLIKASLRDLMNAYPSCANSCKILNQYFGEFCGYVDASNYGKAFENSIALANSVGTQTKYDADKIIFHLIPILTDIFHRTKTGLS